ncbi:MAG TPA: sugar ABC transporter permease, partial [Pseudonocardia sp.]|nr:sugar ABC transporter permease [Pseudonocardia sp.]
FGGEPQAWIQTRPWNSLFLIAILIWIQTGFAMVLLSAAIKGVPHELIEAVQVDGATEGQIFWRVVLPLLTPALVAAALIRLVMGVKAFDEMYLLTRGGPGDATTLVSLHIRNVFFDRLELGYGAAFSLVVVVAVIAGLLVALAVRRTVRHSGAAS